MDITPLNVQYEDVQENAPEVTVTESSPVAAEARTLGRDSPDAAPVVQSEEPIQVFGYLQKQGRRLKGWHQRWFEIRGQHMYYYKTNVKKHCLGEILLSQCTQVAPSSVATFGHPFELTTKERSHILAARTVEDMEKWVDTIKKNMGSRPGPKPTKITKVKKWDSFKNTFAITRHRSVSPQRSNPLPDTAPAATAPANEKRRVDVNRNKSFLDKFKRVRRSNSPAGRRREAELKNEDKAGRPHSEDFTTKKDKLVAGLDEKPAAVSVPNSPLTRKRQETGNRARKESLSPAPQGIQTPSDSSSRASEERSSLSPAPQGIQTLPSASSRSRASEERSSLSPAPQGIQTLPGGSSSGVPSPARTPERIRTPEKPSVTPSPPQNTSTPVIVEPTAASSNEEEKKPVFAKPRPLVPKTSPKSHHQGKKPSPLAQPATEEVPEILTQHLFWEDVRTVLESIESSEPLFPTETLPAQDEPWVEKETPIEQLREFLAVCS